MKMPVITAVALLIAPIGVTAQTDTAAVGQQEQTEAPKERKICKTERMTGSLTRVRRTCLTQAQWDRLAEITRRNVGEVVRDADQRDIETRTAPIPQGGGW